MVAGAGAERHSGGEDDAGGKIDFPALAAELLERHNSTEALASTFDFESFLQGEFVYLRLGLFDLHMEQTSALDRIAADDFVDVAAALLDLQSVWLDWTKPVSKDQADARKQLSTLKDFVKRLRGKAIVAAAKKGGKGALFDLLSAQDSVHDAAEGFSTFMSSGACLGQDRYPERETVVVVPDRRSFLQFLAFAGWLRPELQGKFWDRSVTGWTNCYIDEYRFLSMQLPNTDGSNDQHFKGVSMNERVANGLQQQIAQLSALALVDNYYGSKVPPGLAGGLSVLMTVDVFGECNTRVDGDLSERRTEAYSVFVPGGNPNGGILGANIADSPWRKKQGGDYFADVLKASQRSGAKDARKLSGRLRHFQLKNKERTKRTVVSGPFFGPDAKGFDGLPGMYEGDKEEFLRAYRTGFLHWLRSESMEDEEPSGQAFAEWLRDLADPEAGDFIELTVEGFGGVPLSNDEATEETLEGRYLKWISKS